MPRHVRFVYIALAVIAVAAGLGSLALHSRQFVVWSVALFVAAVALEETAVFLPPQKHVSDGIVEDAAPPEPEVAVSARKTRGSGVAPSPRGTLKVKAPHSVEPADVLQAVEEAAAAAGEVLAAHLWLEDESSATLRLVAATGVFRPTGDPEPITSGLLGSALTSESAVFAPEMTHNTPSAQRRVWRYAVKLTAGDARGVAAVDVAGDEPDRSVLTRVVASYRSSLAGALALHVAREQTRAANALLEATRELSRLVDPDAVIEVLLRTAMALSSAQTGSVMIVGEDGRMSIARSEGLPDDVAVMTSLGEGEGIAGWVLSTGQPVVIEDLECKGPQSRRHGVRSAVSVPIADDDEILGVLNVGNRTFKARFSATHRDSLETLGRMGAHALRTARALETSQALYFDTLKALAIALETKDPYARGTTERVVELACGLAEALGMSASEQTAVRIAALLHDVGMSAAGDLITVSDRPLSTVEWGMVKVHPLIAADVIEQAPALREAIPIVYHHHERYDGEGYVVGLSAQTIPLGARVLAVADAFVAMTSERPYRAAMSQADALREVRENAGTQFDPDVVTALEELVGETARRTVPE